jgi:hypothetical protein
VVKLQIQVSICYMILDQVCSRASGNIIRKRAKVIQTKGMKEKNVHSGQLARTGQNACD